MNMKVFSTISILTAILAFTVEVQAQDLPRRLLAEADSARLAYDFPKAVDLCEQAAASLDSTKRSIATEQTLLARNGLSMMDFCSQPTVVAKQKFPLKDFFLFYPLKDRSWRTVPNQLDSLDDKSFPLATYVPDDARDLYYSAKDSDGIRNIYTTHLKDSTWSVPMLINEQLTSSSDEIFPMVSPDGKSLYFSSRGLYGMGGYDLYVSTWNEDSKDWDVPVNMGFPYSSPYDDFLFINTDDGKYSMFASNRECGKDSVCIYVLEYDGMPIRKAVSDVRELRELARLTPESDKGRMDNAAAVAGSKVEDKDIQRYMDKMKQVRILRDSVSRFNSSLDVLRSSLSSADADKARSLREEIEGKELQLPALNATLQKAVKEMQDIEMEFLLNGVVLDTEGLQAEADKEIVGASTGYAFSKDSYGPSFHLDIAKPKPSFDYSFKILPQGRFAENNSLPDGLVYQIQISTQSNKASVADLKGLSPVFERMNPNLTYTYYAGMFKSYKDVLANLNTVKNRGFRDAIIAAYYNGERVSTKEAKALETKLLSILTIKMYPDNGQSLPEEALAAIREHTEKDLIKTVEDGSVVFRIGPFDTRSEVDALVSELKAAGVGSIVVEEGK